MCHAFGRSPYTQANPTIFLIKEKLFLETFAVREREKEGGGERDRAINPSLSLSLTSNVWYHIKKITLPFSSILALIAIPRACKLVSMVKQTGGSIFLQGKRKSFILNCQAMCTSLHFFLSKSRQLMEVRFTYK